MAVEAMRHLAPTRFRRFQNDDPRHAVTSQLTQNVVEARPGVMVPKTKFFQSRGFYTLRGDATRIRSAPGGITYASWSDQGSANQLDRYGLKTGRAGGGNNTFAVGPSGALYQVEGHFYKDPERVSIMKCDVANGKLLFDFRLFVISCFRQEGSILLGKLQLRGQFNLGGIRFGF